MACFIRRGEGYLFINDVELSSSLGMARRTHRLMLDAIERIVANPRDVRYDILTTDREFKKGGMEEYIDASMILKTNGYSWNKRTNEIVKRK